MNVSALRRKIDTLAVKLAPPVQASSVTITENEKMPNDTPGLTIVRVIISPKGQQGE